MPAKSEKQRRLMAMARAYKRGEYKGEPSEEVKRIAASMSDEDLTDFMHKEAKLRVKDRHDADLLGIRWAMEGALPYENEDTTEALKRLLLLKLSPERMAALKGVQEINTPEYEESVSMDPDKARKVITTMQNLNAAFNPDFMHKEAILKMALSRKENRGMLADKIRRTPNEAKNPADFQVMDADESVDRIPGSSIEKTAHILTGLLKVAASPLPARWLSRAYKADALRHATDPAHMVMAPYNDPTSLASQAYHGAELIEMGEKAAPHVKRVGAKAAPAARAVGSRIAAAPTAQSLGSRLAPLRAVGASPAARTVGSKLAATPAGAAHVAGRVAPWAWAASMGMDAANMGLKNPQTGELLEGGFMENVRGNIDRNNREAQQRIDEATYANRYSAAPSIGGTLVGTGANAVHGFLNPGQSLVSAVGTNVGTATNAAGAAEKLGPMDTLKYMFTGKTSPISQSDVQAGRNRKALQEQGVSTSRGTRMPQGQWRPPGSLPKKASEEEPLAKVAKVLKARNRAHIAQKNFAIPEKAEGAKEKKKSGNYPIHDIEHARSALRLVGMHGSDEEKAQVRAKVYAKYPSLKKNAAIANPIVDPVGTFRDLVLKKPEANDPLAPAASLDEEIDAMQHDELQEKIDAANVRLKNMTPGTKTWNALNERINRMVRKQEELDAAPLNKVAAGAEKPIVTKAPGWFKWALGLGTVGGAGYGTYKGAEKGVNKLIDEYKPTADALNESIKAITEEKYVDPRNPKGPKRSRLDITLEDYEQTGKNMAAATAPDEEGRNPLESAAKEAGKAAAQETAAQVQSRWDKALKWAGENKGKMLMGAGGLAGLYALYKWWEWQQIQKRREAEREDLAKKLALVQQSGGNAVMVKTAMASLSDEAAVMLYDACIPKMAEFIKTAAHCRRRKKYRRTREKAAKGVKTNISKTAGRKEKDELFDVASDAMRNEFLTIAAEQYGLDDAQKQDLLNKMRQHKIMYFTEDDKPVYEGMTYNEVHHPELAKTAKQRIDDAVWGLFKEAAEGQKSGYGNEWVERLQKKAGQGPMFTWKDGKITTKGRELQNTDKQAIYPAPEPEKGEKTRGRGLVDVGGNVADAADAVTTTTGKLDKTLERANKLLDRADRIKDPKVVQAAMPGPTGGAIAGAGIGTLAAHILSNREPLDYLTGGLVGGGVGAVVALLARKKAEEIARTMQTKETAPA